MEVRVRVRSGPFRPRKRARKVCSRASGAHLPARRFLALSCDSSAPCQLRRCETLDDAYRLSGPAAVPALHERKPLQRQSFPRNLSWPILCGPHRQRQTLRRLFVLVARKMLFCQCHEPSLLSLRAARRCRQVLEWLLAARAQAPDRPPGTGAAVHTNPGSRHPRSGLRRRVRAPGRNRRCREPCRPRAHAVHGCRGIRPCRPSRRPRSRTRRVRRGDLVTVALRSERGKPRPRAGDSVRPVRGVHPRPRGTAVRGIPSMFTHNPFAELSASFSPAVIRETPNGFPLSRE